MRYTSNRPLKRAVFSLAIIDIQSLLCYNLRSFVKPAKSKFDSGSNEKGTTMSKDCAPQQNDEQDLSWVEKLNDITYSGAYDYEE